MNNLIIIASFAWAITGFLSLSLTIERHYHDVYGKTAVALNKRYLNALHGLGWSTLLMSFVSAVIYKGWFVGPVAWMGVLAVTAFGLMLLLTYKPSWVIKTTAFALIIAASCMLIVLIR
ncbi:MAG: DUF3325 domain-containing protein [Cellvibrio sp.]|uniref:DUF3325 domain-containing protein n=1 Tax=Cellvibrio sp. TaxID=1965322 RepID=UPI0031A5F4D0